MGIFVWGLVLDLVEMEIGWNFEDVVDYFFFFIEVFDGNVIIVLFVYLFLKYIFVLNSDFELIIVISNVIVFVDMIFFIIIFNWLFGGVGV